MELAGTNDIPRGVSRGEAIAQVRASFGESSGDVIKHVRALGGEVLETVWANRTLLVRLAADQADDLAKHADVRKLDVAHDLHLESQDEPPITE